MGSTQLEVPPWDKLGVKKKKEKRNVWEEGSNRFVLGGLKLSLQGATGATQAAIRDDTVTLWIVGGVVFLCDNMNIPVFQM